MIRSNSLRAIILAALVGLLAYFALSRPAIPGLPGTPRINPPAGLPPSGSPQVGVSPLAGGHERDNRVLGEFDLARIYPDRVLRQGDVKQNLVALTFDDGPDTQFTPQILDALAQKGVRATFFLIGKRLSEAPAVVGRIIAEGHAVGNHTYNHPNVMRFTADEISSEIASAGEALRRFGVRRTDMFRPPYGAVHVSSVESLANSGYRLYLWSVDSLDWRGLNSQQVIDNVVPLVANGSVILMHSAGGPGEDLSGTVQALPVIIDQLRAKGYRFVTLTEMFPVR
ncbi:MAG: polysaccharide deacetylase family protein [Firmicutes bacterium]|nr:polysaccharide deacetylase family protein [Bacillota bacterium]